MLNKRCNLCFVLKSLDNFSKHKGTVDGHTYRCKTCLSAIAREKRRNIPPKEILIDKQRCSLCKETKNANCFSKDKGKTRGLMSQCKECRRKTTLENYHKNFNVNYEEKNKRKRNYALLHKFGLTIEEYELMVKTRNGKCDICQEKRLDKGSGGRNRPLSVDHCHKTNKVRGLLCQKCNMGIGLFEDRPNTLQRAAEYLKNKGE